MVGEVEVFEFMVCVLDGVDMEVYDEVLGFISFGGVFGKIRCCLKFVLVRLFMERIF